MIMTNLALTISAIAFIVIDNNLILIYCHNFFECNDQCFRIHYARSIIFIILFFMLLNVSKS